MQPTSIMAAEKTSIGQIPRFEHTPVSDIPDIAEGIRATFKAHKTKDVGFRLTQLRKLYWAIDDFAPLFLAAMKEDLHMSGFEATFTELDFVKEDLMYVIKNLKNFVQDEKIPGVPLQFAALGLRIHKEPLGAALIISPYNFPVQLSLFPAIGAISAGCTFVLKPSESAPATSMVLKKLIEERLDSSAYRVVTGAVPETEALLDQKWDKIFFTGGTAIGKIIAKKAAETLTPVSLELGGQNPAFITKDADLAIAARRLMWAKCMNAGQVCLSQNYALVERSVVPAFIDALKNTYTSFFPKGSKLSPDYARIINKKQFQRIKKLVDESSGKIVMGGEMDETELFIQPTVLLVNSKSDSLIENETFGPVWSILPYDTLDEAIKLYNEIYPTPLAVFSFGNDAENKKILHETTSGGLSINDAFIHAAVIPVPFGGVGQSGTGTIRGRASFDTFTHRRSIAKNPSWTDNILRVRYMPYSWSRLQRMRKLKPKPDFDRDGNQVRGLAYWTGLIFGLGAGGAQGGLVRWVLVLLTGYLLTAKRQSLGI